MSRDALVNDTWIQHRNHTSSLVFSSSSSKEKHIIGFCKEDDWIKDLKPLFMIYMTKSEHYIPWKYPPKEKEHGVGKQQFWWVMREHRMCPRDLPLASHVVRSRTLSILLDLDAHHIHRLRKEASTGKCSCRCQCWMRRALPT